MVKHASASAPAKAGPLLILLASGGIAPVALGVIGARREWLRRSKTPVWGVRPNSLTR